MIIALEGIDASGKGTVAATLNQALNKATSSGAELLHFPTYDTAVGKSIYRLLTQQWDAVSPSGTRADHDRALTMQALMTLNRFEHYDYLRSFLWSGRTLVLDRYYASGIVYGTVDGLDTDMLLEVHKALPQPRVSILIDISVEESVRRRPERRDDYEQRDGFLAKVRGAYLELFRSQRNAGRPWYVVDGHGSEQEVWRRVAAVVGTEWKGLVL